jgi:hypothetical protein
LPSEHEGHVFFAYADYVIDADNWVIFDVEAKRAIRQAEVCGARIGEPRRASA